MDNKFCVDCGEPIKSTDEICPSCGCRQIFKPQNDYDIATKILLPVGRSGLAISAGYAGLFALLIFPAPLALLLGILAFYDLKKNPQKGGRGRMLFGLITGGIGTLILALLYIGQI
ncbi:MAG TPA: hypothetical protein DD412_01420 [Holosporales bacterium]|nr:hypothetical protein [Holosporales bacterium]